MKIICIKILVYYQVSYEDFKTHMSQMYQQYENQRVDNITDPAIRQQHRISTISGLEENQNSLKITEAVDTSEQSTQCAQVTVVGK